MNGLAGMVVIFDLGFGERGFFNNRPHYRLGAAIQRPVHQELAQFAGNRGLGPVIHGDIGIIPIAHHAQAFEFLALDIQPFLGKVAAFLAKFGNRNLVLVFAFGAILFLDLPFNRQAVAVPSRNINRILAHHLLGPGDHVFQNFVQGMANMQMTIGIGRAIMEHKLFPAFGNPANGAVKIVFLPLLQQCRFHFRQPRPHRKIGLGQDNGLFIFDAHRDSPVVLHFISQANPNPGCTLLGRADHSGFATNFKSRD